jgi:hypothetical protein
MGIFDPTRPTQISYGLFQANGAALRYIDDTLKVIDLIGCLEVIPLDGLLAHARDPVHRMTQMLLQRDQFHGIKILSLTQSHSDYLQCVLCILSVQEGESKWHKEKIESSQKY